MIKDNIRNEDFNYDHYGAVHICFSTPVSKQQLALMNLEREFAIKVKSLLEVNLDFNIWQDNIFKVESSNINKIVELINPADNSPFITQMSDQLVSLCSVMGERPYV